MILTSLLTGWRVVNEIMAHLDTNARTLSHEFDKSVYGVKNEKSMWKTCVQITGFNSWSYSSFVYAASSMYAIRHFKPEDKKQMSELTKYIREAFSEMVDNLDWMDDATKVNIS